MTLLDSFDLPQMNPNCLARSESLVAPQALHLLNDTGVRDLARQAAEQALKAGGDQGLDQLVRQLVGRVPTDAERDLLQAHRQELANAWRQQPGVPADQADQQALQTLAHALLNSALFLYVD